MNSIDTVQLYAQSNLNRHRLLGFEFCHVSCVCLLGSRRFESRRAGGGAKLCQRRSHPAAAAVHSQYCKTQKAWKAGSSARKGTLRVRVQRAALPQSRAARRQPTAGGATAAPSQVKKEIHGFHSRG